MTISFKKNKDNLLFIPLGGSDEIGLNLNVYHMNGKFLLVDMGIGFADEGYPGIDILLPDISFLTKHKDNILGLIITHAHEDHFGAVPYIWDALGCDIYTTEFAATILKEKFKNNNPSIKLKDIPIKIVESGKKYDLAPFSFEALGLTHSVPEMHAIVIGTPKGKILHTGDWKLDPNPVVGPLSDEARLKKLGKDGILALVCDSTNIFLEGDSGSESEVEKTLKKIIKKATGKVAVTTFASNVGRVESIIKAAKASKRKIVLAGRSLWRITDAAQENGYLKGIEFLTDREAKKIPAEEQLIICTGCQGESRAAATKIANGTHPNIKMYDGDTIIFSSSVIPGNEKTIYKMYNDFARNGVEVITEHDHFVHVSGHPARKEMEQMYKLAKPKIAIPMHGEPRHIAEHAKFATKWGVSEAIKAFNGAVVKIDEGDTRIIGEVTSGRMAIDGKSIIPGNASLIKERKKLSDSGCVMISLSLNNKGKLSSTPQVSAPGLLCNKGDVDLIEIICDEISDAVKRGVKKPTSDTIQSAVKKLIKRELDKYPIIKVHVV